MKTSSTGKSGFTIVELIVVVVMIAVLTTMVIPRLSPAASAAELRESARRLLLAASYARDFAATRQRDCRLVIDRESGEYGLSCRDDRQYSSQEFSALTFGIGRAETLPEGVQFGEIVIEPYGPALETLGKHDYIAFSPTGAADAAVIQVTDRRRTYSMLVDPVTGQARLVDRAVYELPGNRLDLDE